MNGTNTSLWSATISLLSCPCLEVAVELCAGVEGDVTEVGTLYRLRTLRPAAPTVLVVPPVGSQLLQSSLVAQVVACNITWE